MKFGLGCELEDSVLHDGAEDAVVGGRGGGALCDDVQEAKHHVSARKQPLSKAGRTSMKQASS